MQRKNVKLYRLLSFALCLLMLSAISIGCSATKNEPASTASTTSTAGGSAATQQTATEATGVKKPQMIEVTREMYFNDASDYPDMKSEFMAEFEKRFGIKLVVHTFVKNEYMTKVNLAITAGDIHGIVNIYGPASNVMKARDDGSILPLDDYLKNNEFWNSSTVPQGCRDIYKFSDDNKTWAIPMGYTCNFFDRAFRKDWLDKLNLSVPKTLDDLYNVAKAFTENDPDGNGKKDTFGLVTSQEWNIQDIFQTFGCTLDNTGSGSITWDPIQGVFVDNMLNPEMVNALKYLNDMYQHGYIDKEMFVNKGQQMRDKFYNGQAGSWYYWWNNGYSSEVTCKKVDPNAEVIEIPSITGKITTGINPVQSSGTPFVLLKGTEEPNEMLNWFINLFYSNEESYWWARYGTDKYNVYDFANKRIIRILDPSSAGGTSGYPAPNLQSDLPWFSSNDYIVTNGDDPAVAETVKANLVKKNKILQDGKDQNLFYELPAAYSSPNSSKYSEISADITKAFDQCMLNSITGAQPIEDAIAKYRSTLKAIGAQQVLDEANKAIGKTSDFKY